MPLTGVAKEAAADAVVALGAYVSVHTADPGTTGTNEATGGTPAYARQATTWAADTTDDGIRVGSQVLIDLPAGVYNHVGFWTAAVGGTFLGSTPVTETTFTTQDVLRVNPVYTQS